MDTVRPTPTSTMLPALKKAYEERLAQAKKGISEVEAALARLEGIDDSKWHAEEKDNLLRDIEFTRKTLESLNADEAEYAAILGINSTE